MKTNEMYNDDKSIRVRIDEAAEMLDIAPQALRFALQQNLVSFGIAIKGTGNSFSYYINRKQLETYLKGIQSLNLKQLIELLKKELMKEAMQDE